MSLRTDYDSWHERIYDADADPSHNDSSSPWYQLVLEYLGEVSGPAILEVACGRSGFVCQLSRSGARATGCDFSASALRAANAKLAFSKCPLPASLIQGDAPSLPFADTSFDAIISCETIEHLPRVLDALREMYRVARSGARLLLTTPNYFNFMGLYELYARFRHRARKDDQPFGRRQWFPQVRHWIRRAGWTILRTDGINHEFPLFPVRNPIRWQALDANSGCAQPLQPICLSLFRNG